MASRTISLFFESRMPKRSHELIGQHFHTRGFIHQLASLDFALNDNARGKVRNSHGRGDFIDVLSTGTTAAEGVDFKIFRIDDNIGYASEFRNDVNRGKRGMTPRIGIEGRDANQAVHTFLTFE